MGVHVEGTITVVSHLINWFETKTKLVTLNKKTRRNGQSSYITNSYTYMNIEFPSVKEVFGCNTYVTRIPEIDIYSSKNPFGRTVVDWE